MKDLVRSYLEYLADDKNKAEAAMNPVRFDLNNGKVVKTSGHQRQSIELFNKNGDCGMCIGPLSYGIYHYKGKQMTPVEYAMKRIFGEEEIDAY